MKKMQETREPSRQERGEFNEINQLFETAVSEYPSLAQVKFESFPPQDEFDAGGYYELQLDQEGQVVPKLFISEGDPEALRPLLEIRKTSVKMTAELLHLPVEDITPEILQLFIVAHELGHLQDFIRNYKNDPDLPGWEAAEEMYFHRDSVLEQLPIPNLSPTNLARELAQEESLITLISQVPELKKTPPI